MRSVTIKAAVAILALLPPACQSERPPQTLPQLSDLEPVLPEAAELADWYRGKQGYTAEQSSPGRDGFLVWSERAGKRMPATKVNLERGRLKGKCVLVQFPAHPKEGKPNYCIVSPAQMDLPAEWKAEAPGEVETIVLLAYSPTQRMYAPKGQESGSPVLGEFCEILAFDRATREVLARTTAVTRFPESTRVGVVPLQTDLIVEALLGVTARREALEAAKVAADRYLSVRRRESAEAFARGNTERGRIDYTSTVLEPETVTTTFVKFQGVAKLRGGHGVWVRVEVKPEGGAWKVSSFECP